MSSSTPGVCPILCTIWTIHGPYNVGPSYIVKELLAISPVFLQQESIIVPSTLYQEWSIVMYDVHFWTTVRWWHCCEPSQSTWLTEHIDTEHIIDAEQIIDADYIFEAEHVGT